MIAALQRLRRALLRRWHHYLIDGDLEYLAACERDGLVDSLSLRAFRQEITRREIRLIELQEPLQPAADRGDTPRTA